MDSVSCVDLQSASAAVKIEPKRQLGEKEARKPSGRRDTPTLTLIICLRRAPGLNKLAGVGSSKLEVPRIGLQTCFTVSR